MHLNGLNGSCKSRKLYEKGEAFSSAKNLNLRKTFPTFLSNSKHLAQKLYLQMHFLTERFSFLG
jgi:hypothetical protein